MADGNDIRGAKGGSESQHVPVEAPDSLRSIAFFRILDLVSEGEIGGLVNGLQSVFVDETPLVNVDGSSNFPKAHVEARTGTPEQTYIKGFDATENEISVGVELKSSAAWVQSLTDIALSAVRITVGVPALSKADTSNGDINGYAIAYKIEVSTDGGAYALAYNGNITGKTTTHFQRSTRVDLPVATTGWQIRVTRLTANANSSAIADTTTIDSYTEIVDGKLAYPNSALVGVMGDASQFSNIPNRAYDMWGRIVSVPSNYDAKTRAYTGTWDGTFKPSWTDNPAWVFYDLIINTRYGLGNLIDAALVDKWALYKIAQYCDGLVSDGNGGQEPRFTCNLYLQTQADAYKLLNDISSIFRGIAYWAGGTIVANADMPEDPVYTYTDANVIDGKFTYASSPRKQRYTAAQVTWNDPRNFYRAKVEYVEYQPGIDRYGWQQTEVTGVGCTSQGMAQRIGLWLCTTSCEETDTVTFSVGMDGTIAAPGQIIRIADAARAGKRQGGRINSATTTTVTVDSAPTVVIGDSLTVNMPDGTAQTRTVSGVSGKTITVGTAFTAAPEPEAVWIVESTTLTAQTFRVVSVLEDTSDDKISFTITALQHNASKFDAIDNGTAIVVPPISVLRPKTLPAPASVTLTSVETAGDVVASTVLDISWTAVNGAIAYEVEWRKDNGNWHALGRHYEQNAQISYAIAGSYIARVRAIDASGDMSVPTTSAAFVVVDQTTNPGFITDLAGDVAAAKTEADAANTQLAAIASDSILSPGEKPVVIREYDVITTEQAGIDAQAVAYGITTAKSDYDNAISTLAAYLAGLDSPVSWDNKSGNTTIVGSTFEANFNLVYTRRQTLLNAIYAAAKAKADAAQATANTAQSLASQVAVINAGFDAGDTGWQKGTGWSIKSDGSFGHGTGYAERVGGADGALRNDAVCFVQPGHSYKVQALIKAIGANGECHARISWRDINDSEISTTPGNAVTGTTVTGSYAVGTPPAGAVFAHAEIAAVGHATGKYQVDNVISTLQPATADEIAESTSRKWAAQSGADKTSSNPQASTWLNDSTNLARGGDSIVRFVDRSLDHVADAGGRYAAVESGADKTAGKSIDVLADGTNYRRTGAGYVDSSGRVVTLWDGTTIRSATNIWDGANRARTGLNSSGNLVGRFATPRLIAGQSFDGSADLPIPSTGLSDTSSLARGGDSIVRFTDRDLSHITDGGGFARIFDTELTSGRHKLGLAGSGMALGDQRNAPSSLTRNLGMVRSATALTAHSGGAVDVNAHTITMGPAVISYNAKANALTGLTTGNSYYIYTRDGYAGGSPTYLATGSSTVANGFDDAYNAGVVTIPSSGTSGGGTGGGGGIDDCVCADMWLRSCLTARDLAHRWRWWRPYMLRGQDGWHFVRQRPRVVSAQCCRVIVADGSWIDCSLSTPVTTRTGESITAPMLHGHCVATDAGWQRVIEVRLLPGDRDVVRICVGGHSFFAGFDPYRRISTHNVWKR